MPHDRPARHRRGARAPRGAWVAGRGTTGARWDGLRSSSSSSNTSSNGSGGGGGDGWCSFVRILTVDVVTLHGGAAEYLRASWFTASLARVQTDTPSLFTPSVSGARGRTPHREPNGVRLKLQATSTVGLLKGCAAHRLSPHTPHQHHTSHTYTHTLANPLTRITLP